MPADRTAPRILVYTGGEIMGDGLNKLPFLRALRRAYPDGQITWHSGNGATVYADKLAPAVTGLIDELLTAPETSEAWRNVFAPRLRDRFFDVIIDTQRKLRATLELKRVPHGLLVSGAANGLLSERRAPGQPWQAAKPTLLNDQLLQLLSLARYGRPDGPLDPSGHVAVSESCRAAAARLLPETGGVILAPGAGGANKRWPLSRFLELGAWLSGKGHAPVFVLGPGEADWRGEIAATVPAARFPLQAASAEERAMEPFLTMAVAQRCRLAVANDSGVGHILAASGVALISLFGPTAAGKFAPYSPDLTVVDARTYGGTRMEDIPLEAVRACVAGRIG